MAQVTDAYADLATYKSVVGKTDSADDAAILLDLQAISRYLDRKLGRFFTKDAADVSRTYRTRTYMGTLPLGWAESENPYAHGAWTRLLPIDDLASLTSVRVDLDQSGTFATNEALASTDYELWPTNAQAGPEPAPYTALYIPPWSSQGGFPPNTAVQVTGKWGWPAIPPAISRACCQLVGILRLETPRSTSRVTEMGERIGTSRAAQDIIEELVCAYSKPAQRVI